jgi:hypothetical protein
MIGDGQEGQPLDFILVLARLLLGLPATDDTEDDDGR